MMEKPLQETKKTRSTIQTTQTPQPNKIKEPTCNTMHARVLNLTSTTFNKEEVNILNLGPSSAIETASKHFVNHLITETENAIR
jgi:hypothetical protein